MELTKQAKNLITHFGNFDIRYQACDILDEFATSIDQNDEKNILALNYKCIYVMIVSLYALNDVPSLRS